MKELKLNFLKRLKISIFNFEQYPYIAADGAKRAMGYLTIIMILFSAILSFCYNIKFVNKMDTAIEYTKDNIPNFEIKDNKFHMDSEEPLEFEDGNYKIVLDNSSDYKKYNDELLKYDGVYILLNQNNIIIKLGNLNPMAYNYNNLLDRLEIGETNKNNLIDKYFEYRTRIIITLFVYIFIELFLVYMVSTLIDILALSLIGIITERFAGFKVNYGAMFSMSTSAITLSIILNLIYLCTKIFTGFTIKNFQILYTIISYIYIVTAILMMKSNLVTKKTEAEKDNKEENKGENKEENKEEKGRKADETE